MSTCASCGRRLARGAAFCGSCGRATGNASTPVTLELDDRGSVVGGHEVVLAPAHPPRWWVAGGLVAVVVAVVAASVMSGDGSAGAAPTTTSASPTTTAAPAFTSTEAATTTTTTIPARLTVGTGPLFGEPTGLGLLVAFGRLTYRVDLDAATITMVDLGSGVYELQLTPAGLLYRSADDGELQLRLPGGAWTRRLGDSVQFLGTGPADRSWFVRFEAGVRPTYWYEDADRVRHEFTVESGYAMPDGVGGLVIDAPGGTYRWLPDTAAPRRVSYGRLQTAGGGRVLLDECDDAMQCADVVLDLRTGERTPPPVPATPTSPFTYGRLSPDGQVTFVVHDIQSGSPSWSAVAADGATVPLGTLATDCLSAGCTFAPQWSPDGRWVVWSPDQTSVSAWRVGLPAPVRLTLPDLPEAGGTVDPGRPELSFTIGALADVVAIGGDR